MKKIPVLLILLFAVNSLLASQNIETFQGKSYLSIASCASIFLGTQPNRVAVDTGYRIKGYEVYFLTALPIEDYEIDLNSTGRSSGVNVYGVLNERGYICTIIMCNFRSDPFGDRSYESRWVGSWLYYNVDLYRDVYAVKIDGIMCAVMGDSL
jgi:hypothetical protein